MLRPFSGEALATNRIGMLITPLLHAVRARDADTKTDGQLLEQFVAQRDETAFAALVRRHGPMVLGVCKRVLGNDSDAEDAFQVTFIVLVRKAGSLISRSTVGDWLHGVARCTALKAKVAAARRRVKEQVAGNLETPNQEPRNDWLALLDEAVSQLPEKYRLPIVLCDLEGKTRQQVAEQLAWPEGTVAGRLVRGRALLAKHLLRRAVMLSGAVPAALTASVVNAAMSIELAHGIVQTATSVAVGGVTAKTVVSAKVLTLAQGVIQTMFWNQLKTGFIAILLTLATVAGGGLTVYSFAGSGPPQPAPALAQAQPLQRPPALAPAQPAKPLPELAPAEPPKAKEEPKPEKKKDDAPKKRKPKITIGKETTFATGPIDADGYLDYIAALNEKMREGVTPANNANVLLSKAFGPHPDGAKMSPKFFEWMKIAAPPEKGDYFVNDRVFRKDQLKLKLKPEELQKFGDDVEKSMTRPWKAKEYPQIAAWLKANEKPLAVVVEATKRSHYYHPLVAGTIDGKPGGLISAVVPAAQQCRQLTTVLTARAMLHLAEGRPDEAWQDLLTVHRLGRHVGRGGSLIEGLVGIAIDSIASEADLAFLDAAKLDAKRLKNCLRDLQALPPLPSMADKVDLGERYMFLDSVVMVDRGGIEYFDIIGGGRGKSDVFTQALMKVLFADVDWDPGLRNANRYYTRLAAAMHVKDRGMREKQLNELEKEIKDLKTGLLTPAEFGKTLLGANNVAEAKGKFLGDLLMTLMVPAVRKVQHASDRTEQIQHNLHVAFALAAYKSDEGNYPKTLDALAPKYLAAIPQDMFSGKALIYRPADNGYLLYSVGINGRDDEGRSYYDNPPGDDLRVRMPLRK